MLYWGIRIKKKIEETLHIIIQSDLFQLMLTELIRFWNSLINLVNLTHFNLFPGIFCPWAPTLKCWPPSCTVMCLRYQSAVFVM